MATLQEKIAISANSAVLFYLLNLPFTYKLTNRLFSNTLYNTKTNCPTTIGLLVHTLIFFLITFLTMGNLRERNLIKLKHSLTGTAIFFIVSSPMIYSLMSLLLGKQVASLGGCQTLLGSLLHALIYFSILLAIMYLP